MSSSIFHVTKKKIEEKEKKKYISFIAYLLCLKMEQKTNKIINNLFIA